MVNIIIMEEDAKAAQVVCTDSLYYSVYSIVFYVE